MGDESGRMAKHRLRIECRDQPAEGRRHGGSSGLLQVALGAEREQAVCVLADQVLKDILGSGPINLPFDVIHGLRKETVMSDLFLLSEPDCADRTLLPDGTWPARR